MQDILLFVGLGFFVLGKVSRHLAHWHRFKQIYEDNPREAKRRGDMQNKVRYVQLAFYIIGLILISISFFVMK